MLWLRILLFALLVPGTALGLVPARLLGGGWAHAIELGAWHYAGLPVLAAGIALMAWCVVDFGRRGRGTPAPIDPPRRLVVSGPYAWVRNPMYVGAGLVVLGEAVFWEAPRLLAYLGGLGVITHLFVVGYEERALARKFGEDYQRYRARVPRWIPRPPRP